MSYRRSSRSTTTSTCSRALVDLGVTAEANGWDALTPRRANTSAPRGCSAPVGSMTCGEWLMRHRRDHRPRSRFKAGPDEVGFAMPRLIAWRQTLEWWPWDSASSRAQTASSRSSESPATNAVMGAALGSGLMESPSRYRVEDRGHHPP